MDWNWFFSSVAQSVAALVGIFSAFITARIVSNESGFTRRNTRARETIVSTKRYRDTMSDRIARLRMIEAKIEQNSPRPSAMANVRFVRAQVGQESEEGLRRQLDEELHSINSLVVDVRQHMRWAEMNFNEISGDPQFSAPATVFIVLTMVLFFGGVIYPLSFLPVDNAKPPSWSSLSWSLLNFLYALRSLKGAILAVSSMVFVVIMVYLSYVNLSLRYDKEMLAQLHVDARPDGYPSHPKVTLGDVIELKSSSESAGVAEPSESGEGSNLELNTSSDHTK